MKVTPRVPVPRDTFPPEFTEMRYIRSDSDSWVAAMLFGLFEAASSPIAQPLKEMLLTTFNPQEEFYQGLMKGMVDCCEKRKVAFWNSNRRPLEYLTLIVENTPGWNRLGREELWGKIQATFPVVFSFNQPPEYAASQWIYISLWEHRGQVVIVYQGYTVESFVVPPCGCVLLKYSCFQNARCAAGGHPADIAALQRTDLACPICSQREHFADFVFNCGKETAELCNEAKNNTEIQLPGTCESCRKVTPADAGHHCNQCTICDNCALLSLLTQASMFCPSCGIRMPEYSLESLYQKLQQISVQSDIRWLWDRTAGELQRFLSTTSETNLNSQSFQRYADTPSVYFDIPGDQRLCELCRKPRRIEKFKVYVTSKHGCFVCDICFETERIPRTENCSKCSQRLDSEIIERIDQLSQKSSDVTAFKCLCCGKIFNKDNYECNSQLSHWWKCRICDYCFIFNNSYRSVCGSCSIPYTEHEKAAIQTVFQSKRKQGKIVCENCNANYDLGQYSIVQEINHMCRVCDSCMINENKMRPRPYCPSCKKSLEEIAPGSTEKQCKKCSFPKAQENFTMKDSLHHQCPICNDCLASSTNFPHCPFCHIFYDDSDKTLLLSSFPSLSPSLACRKCNKPAKGGRYECRDYCICSKCHLTAYLLTDSKKCDYCRCEISGMVPTIIRCTRCYREIHSLATDIEQSICGVCTSGCILCCYCIDSNGTCRECNLKVSFGKYRREEITQIQNQAGDKACYCFQKRDCDDTLSCGHRIHQACKGIIFVCRICSATHNHKPEKISLEKYISK